MILDGEIDFKRCARNLNYASKAIAESALKSSLKKLININSGT